MTEPKIRPDRDQMTRWLRLLSVPADHPTPVDALKVENDLRSMRLRHRPWIVAAVTAVNAANDGTRLNVPHALPSPPTRVSAAAGADVADGVWGAYLQWTIGNADATDWLRAAIALLDPTALVFTANDNPEPWWQNEMLILHALHSFALRMGDMALIEKTLACADFHLREIQPDHATNEPWSVHAYASHPDGNVTAETLLHAGYIQHGGALGPVARQVARDARGALAAYLKA